MSDWMMNPYGIVRHVILEAFSDRGPHLRPADLINNALTGRRKKRKATKDRSKIKAARKQRNRK